MDLPNPIHPSIPFFAIFIAIEWLFGHLKKRALYDLRDTITSLSLAILSAISVAAYGILTVQVYDAAFSLKLYDIGISPLTVIICFFLDDFFYYFLHRGSHRIRWMWASHVVHHSSFKFNLAVALRQNITSFISLTFIFRLPLIVIGFPPAVVLFCAGIGLIYQFWLHTETIGKLPRPLELIFNTPSNHRVHHATNTEYIDKNYGGLLMIWDHLFASYAEYRDEIEIKYGVIKPPKPRSIVSAALHEWADLLQCIRAAPTLKEKVLYCIKEPGWSAEPDRQRR